MIDVAIAGAGIAGSALAIGLGRRGYSVEVFDQCLFPREKPCGEGLMPAGVAALERLGVPLPQAQYGGEFFGIRYHFGEQVTEGRFPRMGGLPAGGRGIRRRDLDHALAETAARTPGVRLHLATRVKAALVEDGRVTGLVLSGNPARNRHISEARDDRAPELLRARLVVAADGAQSRLRHLLGLNRPPRRRKRIGMRAHFHLAAGQTPQACVEVFLGRGHELYVTPLPQGELLVAALADSTALAHPVEEQFRRWRDAQPALARRLCGAEQISGLLVTSPLSGRARRRILPGFVLLGDAAGSTDPITGGGITQALLAAELLAEHAGNELGSGHAWLAEFDRQREAMLRDYRRVTAMVLWLADHPALVPAALGMARRAPGVFSHLLGVSGGMLRLWGGRQPQYARRIARATA